MQIDLVKLNLGQVVVKDYSIGDKPLIKAYDIGMKDKEYRNIQSVQEFATLVMVQAMGPAALKGAKIYAAATLLGVGFLPAGVAGVLIAKDDATVEYRAGPQRAFMTAKKVVEELGELVFEDQPRGLIKAKISGTDFTITITKTNNSGSAVNVKARKMMLPKLELANGFLYQLSKYMK